MFRPTCHSVFAYEYIGCYRDANPQSNRDLQSALYLEDKMTVDWCQLLCQTSPLALQPDPTLSPSHSSSSSSSSSSLSPSSSISSPSEPGFSYFGVQFGMECRCGRSYGRHGAEASDKCNMPCGGNPAQNCGGELANDVYRISSDHVRPAPFRHSSGRPLLGLVMIVKDEAHTLPDTLQSIKPYLDVYHILDTGSKDGTQDMIRAILGADRGVVYEEPFIDYGASRNRALELAQLAGQRSPIFSLMLSADETVFNAHSLRNFVEQYAEADGDQHEAYSVQMDVGWRFDSLRLSRTDKGWRYVRRVHEYLSAPDGRFRQTLRVPLSFIRFRVTDPQRREEREWTILRILIEDKRDNPNDTRTSFYLARTYNVLRNHTEALNEFRRRVSLGGWQEEVYESLYAIAWQLEALKEPWPLIHHAFLEAYEHSPERAEPLYAIASHFYKEKQIATAFVYAFHASTLPYPTKASLWVQRSVYEWQCHFLVGMTAYKLERYVDGARSLMTAARYRPNDPLIEQQLQKYKHVLSQQQWETLQSEHAARTLQLQLQLQQQHQQQQSEQHESHVAAAALEAGSQEQTVPNLAEVTPVPSSSTSSPRFLGLSERAQLILVIVLSLAVCCLAVAVVVMWYKNSRPPEKYVRGADGAVADKLV